MGILTAFCDLFIGVGSFAAGAVATSFGYPTTFVMAAAALLASAAAGWYVYFQPVQGNLGSEISRPIGSL
jgi:hypothetical protein